MQNLASHSDVKFKSWLSRTKVHMLLNDSEGRGDYLVLNEMTGIGQEVAVAYFKELSWY
jgi:hypothetical protein